MNISNNNYSNIFDLPNEILFIIIKKLNIGDVIYSLVNVNERLFHLLFDPFYMQNLNITLMTIKSFYQRTFSLHEQVLSNICENILPNIHDQVKQLTVEQHSIERILTHNYSQLYSLSLVNFKEEILCKYLRDHSALRDLLTHQITHLNIDIQSDEIPTLLSKISSYIFILILSLCQRLIKLNFCQVFSYRNSFSLIYKLPQTSCSYSTLIELKINVATFNACLCLLDGHFDCLSKLTINVGEIKCERKQINNETKLPKLKHFSLTSFDMIHDYDKYIIPLLHRMINLEELILFLTGQYAHVDVTQYLLGPIQTPTATPATDENKNEDDHDNQDQDEDIEEDDNNDIYDQIEIETDNEQDPSDVFVQELNRNKTNVNQNKT
ncbi:unnamed protein product [Adineta steineri]|uniref:F-box domain-containing protein n=1 Tax=Adineta steineri TaxID=433720 RepID=A0A815B9G7_9BILA|nr:unnamed protein product [Adineta steineri]